VTYFDLSRSITNRNPVGLCNVIFAVGSDSGYLTPLGMNGDLRVKGLKSALFPRDPGLMLSLWVILFEFADEPYGLTSPKTRSLGLSDSEDFVILA